MRERLLKTAFYTALFSYLAFAVIEYAAPGFVSYVFSVHLVGLIAMILGAIWVGAYCHTPLPRKREASTARFLLVFAIGTVLFVIVWREGEAFGDVRLPLALGALVVPWLSYRLLSAEEK